MEASVVGALLAALRDDGSVSVRREAALALGRTRSPRAVDALLAALDKEHPTVRKAAALSLGLTGDRKARDALLSTLAHDSAVCREAALALGMLPNDEATAGRLAELLSSGTIEGTRKNAALALGLLHKEFHTTEAEVLNHYVDDTGEIHVLS